MEQPSGLRYGSPGIPRLKICRRLFHHFNPETAKEVLEGLQLAANHFRKIIGTKTALRFVPEIRFKIDDSFAEADKIEKLLHDPKVTRDLSEN